MVALLLGHSSDAIHEVQRLLEIGEAEFAEKMMLVDDPPLWQIRQQFLKLLTF